MLCDYGCGKEAIHQFKNGKWCCSENYQSCPFIRKKLCNRKASDETRRKMSESQKGNTNCKGRKLSKDHKESFSFSGKTHSEKTKKKISKSLKGRTLSKEHRLNIGEAQKGISPFMINNIKYASYKTYSKALVYDETKRDDEFEKILNAKCEYCGKWFRPTLKQAITRRVNMEKGCGKFYCSDECKLLCPTFGQNKYPKNFKNPSRSIEISHELKQMVFERDNWICQICGGDESLKCHHIDPVTQNPMFANDMDSCITLCKKCHKFVHTQVDGCGYSDLKRKECG